MLTHPTLDTLQALSLHGMYTALNEQMQMPDIAPLSFEERLGLWVDREGTARRARQLTTRLRQAKLRQSACLEDVDYQPRRGLDKALLTRLATCQWVREHRHILITGPTGGGENLDRLCTGPSGLPGRVHPTLSPPPPAAPRTATKYRRRTLSEADDHAGQDGAAPPG
jgi:hypothetical protein